MIGVGGEPHAVGRGAGLRAEPIGQGFWLYVGIELLPGEGDELRRQGHTQHRGISQGFGKQQGIEGAGGGPLRQAVEMELDAADVALQFGKAEIGAKTLV